MYLHRIAIKNFRNFVDFSIELKEGLNVVVGENNIGKTNLMDAVRAALGPASSNEPVWLDEDDLNRSAVPGSIMRVDLTFAQLSKDERADFIDLLNYDTASPDQSTASVHCEWTWDPNGKRWHTRRWGGERAEAETGITGKFRLRDVLVLSEMTVSVVLLVGAGLLIRSLILLENVNPGFQANNVMTTRLALPGSKYSDGVGVKVTAFWHDAIRNIEAIPGVESAAVTSELPLSGLNNPSPRTATADGGEPHHVYLRSVSPGYWNVMRIPLLAGRYLSADDRKTSQRVVVINQALRKEVFGDRDSIGQRVTFDFQERNETENYQAVVVGVTGDVHHTSLAAAPFREAYIPLDQSPLFNYDLVVRTTINPKSIVSDLRNAIWSLDRDESVGTLRTLDDVVGLDLAQPKFRGYVLAAFAAMALVLSASSLYGLLSFLVAQRSREIGVRMALGAMPMDIFRLIVGKGLSLALEGILAGLLLAFGLVRFMRTLVYGISFEDPVTFVAGALVLLIVAVLASYVPARQAVNLNPVDVLGTE